MPRYSKTTSTNEELGCKYAINRATCIQTEDTKPTDDIYKSRFHISESFNASKQWFKKQKKMLKKRKILFEDPLFSADDSSLYYQQKPREKYEWKRPKEISTKPTFIGDGPTRFDVNQGNLGDCWLLAAVSSLSMHQNLLSQIMPDDQEFKKSDYAGIFMFRFWKFGTWVDVVVDDRLPTLGNKLVYLHSADPNEFWSALMEKAYAKLNNSYEALESGLSSEAMEDFTGGISEIMSLGPAAPADLWESILRADKFSSLMGCGLLTSSMEDERPFGLICNHAYSITEVTTVNTNHGQINMIRVRNPWGDDNKWTGAWSDVSIEWNDVSEQERKRIGFTKSINGEFWMSFDDFVKYFTTLEFCHLSPESEVKALLKKKKRKWEMCIEDGEWKRNVSAGGCRKCIKTFHINPQFHVNITHPDIDDINNQGTLIIGLLQKDMRAHRKEGQDLLVIGYAIYALKDGRDDNALLDTAFFCTNEPVTQSDYVCMREVCGRHKLPVGKYVIVPSTIEPGEEANFLLRIFSEKPYDSKQCDQQDEIAEPTWTEDDTVDSNVQVKEVDHVTKTFKQTLMSVAEVHSQMDSYKLQSVLNDSFRHENFQFNGFSNETCRSLVALMDADQTGMLGVDTIKILWDDLRLWKTVFKKFDTDKSGNFNAFEIRQALKYLGFIVSNRVYTAITTRYINESGTIEFDDFILLLARLKTIFLTLKAQKTTPSGDYIFPKDQFIQCVLYM